MSAIWDRFRSRLSRDQGLPLSHKLGKLFRYLRGRLTAPVHLRRCDAVGLQARTVGRPLIENAGQIRLGHEPVMYSLGARVRFETGPRGCITAGNNLLVNFGAQVSCDLEVRMGDRVGLGPYSIVCDHDERAPADDPDPRPIVIEDDVLLTARVLVRRGSVIGKGALIAAGSVVDGEIPAGAIAGGIPARVLQAGEPHARPRIGAEALPSGITSPWHRRVRGVVLLFSPPVSRFRLRGLTRVGKRCRVLGGALHVENLGRILIGDDVRLVSSPIPVHLVTDRKGCIELGNGVVMGPGSGVTSWQHVRIEDGVELGPGVMVYDTDFHRIEDFNARPAPRPTVIGSGAHLERNVIVLKGSTVGAGARVAAGSVVLGEIPAGATAAGVPARVISSETRAGSA
jgi:acetyltransferase-like isoleucine patch superfamily enzyme